MRDDETTLGAIHRLYAEVLETNSRMRAMRDNLKDVMLQNAEYQELQDEIKELTAKRAQAKNVLKADRDYQVIAAELEELKFKKSDLMQIMSYHLITHRDATHEESIKDPEGEARQIIVNAKLGKPELVIDGEPARRSTKPLPNQSTIQSKIEGYGQPGGRSYGISDGKTEIEISEEGIKSKKV
jgi:hypothetical protein